MKLLVALSAAALLGLAAAECPNACSGHGFCSNVNDYCECESGWSGNDCSRRTCPWGNAWVDVANGDLDFDGDVDSATMTYSTTTQGGVTVSFRLWERHAADLYGARTNLIGATDIPLASASQGVYSGEGHFYAECSNAGLCNHDSGHCECFPGFEGHACQRSSCPNDCSGHGVCRFVSELDTSHALWEADKVRQCVCDPGYDGPDCSRRLCPKGDDPLNGAADVYEVQTVTVACTGAISGTFRLVFTDNFGEAFTTAPIDAVDGTTAGLTVAAAAVESALEALPNDAIPDVTVTATDATDGTNYIITFSSNSGDLAALTIDSTNQVCGTSTNNNVAETTPGTTESDECSSRGMCDYETGLCQCFRGYTGGACSEQNALAG